MQARTASKNNFLATVSLHCPTVYNVILGPRSGLTVSLEAQMVTRGECRAEISLRFSPGLHTMGDVLPCAASHFVCGTGKVDISAHPVKIPTALGCYLTGFLSLK
jgi:hypothetical protein